MSRSKHNYLAAESSLGTDIISALFEDHKPIKELIQVMKDLSHSLTEREAAFEALSLSLITHTRAEQETLFDYMKKTPNLKRFAWDAQVEHLLAERLLKEIKDLASPETKSTRIKDLAELIENHIEQEENIFIPKFEQQTTPELRRELGTQFLNLKTKYLIGHF